MAPLTLRDEGVEGEGSDPPRHRLNQNLQAPIAASKGPGVEVPEAWNLNKVFLMQEVEMLP
jgi:hypothetical protein